MNLLDTLTQTVSPEILQGLSRCVGESDSAARTGVASLLPALLGGLASKATTPSGAGSVLSMLQGNQVDTGLIGTIGNLLGSGQTGSLMQLGTSLLSGLVGSDKVSGLGSALASISNMKASSAGNLAAMVAPLVFAALKRVIGQNGLDAGGLASMLAKQADNLGGGKLDSRLTTAMGLGSPESVLASLRAVPGAASTAATGLAGTAAAGVAGVAAATAAVAGAAAQGVKSAVSGAVPAAATAAAATAAAVGAGAASSIKSGAGAAAAATSAAAAKVAAPSGGIGRWLPWIIGAGILAFLIPQLKTCGTEKAATPSAPAAAPKAAAPAPAAPAPAAPAPAPAAAPAAPVAAAPAAPAPTAVAPAAPSATAAPAVGATAGGAANTITWPAKIYFQTGKAAPGADGDAIIKSAAAALVADAGRKISLTGYTDKTGNADANAKLARDRAVGVRDALKAAGVAEDRIAMKPPIFVESGQGNDAEARRVDIILE